MDLIDDPAESTFTAVFEIPGIKTSDILGENGNRFNGDRAEQRIGFEKTGQELEDDNQYDCDLDLSMIGRQI